MTDSTPPIRFDTRIALMLRGDLAPWQELNVAAFLASGVASDASLLGEKYRDADGVEYLPLLRQPVIIYSGDAGRLSALRSLGVKKNMRVAVYTSDMFRTTHDEANRAAVAAVPAGDLDLVGVAIHGPRNAVDRITKGSALHP